MMFAQLALVFAVASVAVIATPVFEGHVLETRQAAANCARNYTVLLGDTCDSISRCQGVSTFQIAHVNPVVNADCSNLSLGQPLCMGVTGQDCKNLHIIQMGENCAGILSGAGLTLAELRVNNPNVDSGCANIYPGEVLCVEKNPINYT